MEAGVVLDGKYRLVAPIGQGGMGSVWRAQHLGLDAPVALKLMTREMAAHPEAVRRFTQEAKAAASLRSPHVVQILDYGVDPASREPFIAMELLEGDSLSSRIRRCTRLSLADTVRVIAHVARALTLAHAARIVHRDLKPDNIFLVRNGDEEVAKVLDFGIAKSSALASGLSAEHAQTATGSVLGTPFYMSPEQITSSKSVDHRSDLWSLAVIACECLTGKRPFHSDSALSLAVMICQGQGARPSSLGPVPPGFDEWFARGTALDRERRFQSASELAESLAAPLGLAATAPVSGAAATPVPALVSAEKTSLVSLDRTVSALVQPAPERASPWPSWRTPVLAVFAALAAGGVVWALTRMPDEASEATPLAAPEAAVSTKRDSTVTPRAAAEPVVAAPVIGQAPPAAVPAPVVTQPKVGVVAATPTSDGAAPPQSGTTQRAVRRHERPAPAKPRERAAPRAKKAFDPYDNL